jgi:RNA polymerase sigma factor (TIGR02999 family)
VEEAVLPKDMNEVGSFFEIGMVSSSAFKKLAFGAPTSMTDITRILSAIEQGDGQAADELLPLVYNELRALARQKMVHEAADHTLQATALVHEAYVRLVDTHSSPKWQNRRHFFAAAAQAMRRILVERARRKKRLKHGGEFERIVFEEPQIVVEGSTEDELLAVNEGLERLAAEDELAAELVKLRYFAGLSIEQAAEILGISPRTAHRNWAFARAWLFRFLEK